MRTARKQGRDYSSTQFDLFEWLETTAASASPCSKTSPASSPATAEETLQQYLERWLGPTLTHQKASGKAPELRSVQMGQSSGAYWTRSGSEWRSGAVVCSLSQILETGPVDRRFFLSPKACSGILRRAERRGEAYPQRCTKPYRQRQGSRALARAGGRILSLLSLQPWRPLQAAPGALGRPSAC